MPKTTDTNKLNSQQLRAEYKTAVARIEETRSLGDFLFRLHELLRVPKYAIWRATKFDPSSGRPTELTLKTEKHLVRQWMWHPATSALPEEFKIHKLVLDKLKRLHKAQTKSGSAEPTLWFDHEDKSMAGPFLLMDFHSRSLSYNANESGGYINVLRFTPICKTQPLYPQFNVLNIKD